MERYVRPTEREPLILVANKLYIQHHLPMSKIATRLNVPYYWVTDVISKKNRATGYLFKFTPDVIEVVNEFYYEYGIGTPTIAEMLGTSIKSVIDVLYDGVKPRKSDYTKEEILFYGKLRNSYLYDLNKLGIEEPLLQDFMKDVVGVSRNEGIQIVNNNSLGLKFGQSGVSIDHIVPRSKAREYAEENGTTVFLEINKLHHISNIQLLPHYFNCHVKRTRPFCSNLLYVYMEARKIKT